MCEGLVDKLRPLLEEGTQLKLLRVIGRNAVVCDARASIEVHAGVDVHEGGALCHVEDVSHPEFLQPHRVLGNKPGEGSKMESVEQEAKFLYSLVKDIYTQRTQQNQRPDYNLQWYEHVVLRVFPHQSGKVNVLFLHIGDW